MGTALVVENSPHWHLGRIEAWLADTGLEPVVVRPYDGDSLDASGHAAIIALGGGRGVDWTPELTKLLRTAVAEHTPTLAFCSSARALATDFGGVVTPVERFAPGPRLVARRDAAADDPLFGLAPMALDVVWWRHEDLTELPPEAQLLGASPHGVPEIFRIGDRAWGIQSHIEFDSTMVVKLGGEEELGQRVDMIADYIDQTWRPIIARFTALATGRVAGTPLPILGQ
ncbi:type 1 glutamine amidotransferase [Stackebrandtia soli]|uniref:type 1 glutamine amidotransferase n=1 Tax=Stackebrandtia soli TaxID=1892856 RepID=UPI0039EB6E35